LPHPGVKGLPGTSGRDGVCGCGACHTDLVLQLICNASQGVEYRSFERTGQVRGNNVKHLEQALSLDTEYYYYLKLFQWTIAREIQASYNKISLFGKYLSLLCHEAIYHS
jgi:hypothetical protein